MAGAPPFKVFNQKSEYVAAFKFIDHALLFVSAMMVPGFSVRLGHSSAATLWTHGAVADGVALSDMDAALEKVQRRLKDIHRKAYDKHHGEGAFDRKEEEQKAALQQQREFHERHANG